MSYDSNQKHPKIEYKGTYPNLHVTQGFDGYQLIRSLEPGLEAFFEIHPSGNYRGHGPDGQHVDVTVDKKHEYNGDGKSSTTDGHHDEKTGGSHRHNVDGGAHKEVAGNQYQGGGGVVITGSQDSHIHSVTSGDHFGTTEGNVTTDHTGDVHHNVTGDFIQFTSGHRLETITGEYGINNQTGNTNIQTDAGSTKIISHNDITVETENGDFLVKADNGKGTVYSLNDMLIQSDSKITIKVGGSTITLTPDGIVLKGARIDLNP